MKTKKMKALSTNELRDVNGGYGYGFGINPDNTGHIGDFPRFPEIKDPFDIGRPPLFI